MAVRRRLSLVSKMWSFLSLRLLLLFSYFSCTLVLSALIYVGVSDKMFCLWYALAFDTLFRLAIKISRFHLVFFYLGYGVVSIPEQAH